MDVYASMDVRLPLSQLPGHAKRAERLGYSGLNVPEAVHDGLLLALLALEHTTRLRVATSVLLAFPRSPTSVAYSAWDLASLSGGRFQLGLGSQVKGNIEGRFGAVWTAPVPRMREYLAALEAIFHCWRSGEELRFEGEHYRLTRMQRFFRPDPMPHAIPLFLGGVNPAMTRLAGEAAKGIMTHPTNSHPRYLREVVRPNLEQGAKKVGRSIQQVSIMAAGFVATGADTKSVEKERESVRQHLAFLYSTPQYWPTLDVLGLGELGKRLQKKSREGDWNTMAACIDDQLLHHLIPSGTYEEIADILIDWYGEIAHTVTFPMPQDPMHDVAAARVIEKLRAHTA